MREDLERARVEIEREIALEDNASLKAQKSSFFKKKVVFVVALLLIFIMLSYFYLGYPVYSYVLGLAGSSTLSGNDVLFRDSHVVSFDDDTLTFLQELYDPFADERALCLTGSVEGNEYVVSSFYEPLIFDSSWNFVSHSPCSSETIVMFHTHPFSRCEPSSTDRNTLRLSQMNNPDVIMVVMCGRNRFSAVI